MFKVRAWCALLEQLESPPPQHHHHHHFHNYSAFICAATSSAPRKKKKKITYKHKETHIQYIMFRYCIQAPTFTCICLYTHVVPTFLFLGNSMWGLRILQSLGRHIEPVINHWIQRYLWDVPIQIRLCQCAVLCVGGCSLSAPAPFISKQLLYIRFEGLVFENVLCEVLDLSSYLKCDYTPPHFACSIPEKCSRGLHRTPPPPHRGRGLMSICVCVCVTREVRKHRPEQLQHCDRLTTT